MYVTLNSTKAGYYEADIYWYLKKSEDTGGLPNLQLFCFRNMACRAFISA